MTVLQAIHERLDAINAANGCAFGIAETDQIDALAQDCDHPMFLNVYPAADPDEWLSGDMATPKAFDALMGDDPAMATRVVEIVRRECRLARRPVPYPFARRALDESIPERIVLCLKATDLIGCHDKIAPLAQPDSL